MALLSLLKSRSVPSEKVIWRSKLELVGTDTGAYVAGSPELHVQHYVILLLGKVLFAIESYCIDSKKGEGGVGGKGGGRRLMVCVKA